MSTEKYVVLVINDQDTDETIVSIHYDIYGAHQKAFDDILGCAAGTYSLDECGLSLELLKSFEEEQEFFCKDNDTKYSIYYAGVEE